MAGFKKHSPGCKCCGGCRFFTQDNGRLVDQIPPPGWTIYSGTWNLKSFSEFYCSTSNALMVCDTTSDLDGQRVQVFFRSKLFTSLSVFRVVVNFVDPNNYYYAELQRTGAVHDFAVLSLHRISGGSHTELSRVGALWNSVEAPLTVYYGKAQFGRNVFLAHQNRPDGGNPNDYVEGKFSDSDFPFRIGQIENQQAVAWIEAPDQTGNRFGLATGAIDPGDEIQVHVNAGILTGDNLNVVGEGASVNCPKFHLPCAWVTMFPMPGLYPNTDVRTAITVPPGWQVASGIVSTVLTGNGVTTKMEFGGRVRAITTPPSSTIRGWSAITASGIYSAAPIAPTVGYVTNARVYFNNDSYAEWEMEVFAATLPGSNGDIKVTYRLVGGGGLLATSNTTIAVQNGGGGRPDYASSDLGLAMTVCYDGTTLSGKFVNSFGQQAVSQALSQTLSGACSLATFVPGAECVRGDHGGAYVVDLRAGYDSTLNGNPYCNKCSRHCASVLDYPANIYKIGYELFKVQFAFINNPAPPADPKPPGYRGCAQGTCPQFNTSTYLLDPYRDVDTVGTPPSQRCEWIYEGELPGDCEGGTAFRITAAIIFESGVYQAQVLLELLDDFTLIGEWRYILGATKPSYNLVNKTLSIYRQGVGLCNLSGSTVTITANL